MEETIVKVSIDKKDINKAVADLVRGLEDINRHGTLRYFNDDLEEGIRDIMGFPIFITLIIDGEKVFKNLYLEEDEGIAHRWKFRV